MTKRFKAVVVGSGAGGAPAARELARQWGDGVAIIEAGRDYAPGDLTQLERDMVPRLYVGAGTQGTEDGHVGILQGQAVGGSTLVNDAICFRPPPEIVDRWRQYGVELDFAELESLADEVEQAMGVVQIPKSQINKANYLVGLGAARLGWHGERLRHNSPGCVECGFRHVGCTYGVKRSTNLSFIPDAVAAGAHLLTETTVRSLSHSGDGWIVETSAGQIRSDVVVLAAGIVQTPAILLRSGINAGNGLQFHVQSVAWGDFGSPVDGFNGIPMSYGVMEFADVYGRRGPGYIMEGVGVQPMAFSVQPPGQGAFKSEILSRYRYLSGVLCLVRARGRGSVRLDRNGDPVISYDLDPFDAQRVGHFYNSAAELYFAAGARRVLLPHRRIGWLHNLPGSMDIRPGLQYLYTAHPFGGACRGTVTDSDGQVVGQKNLWVLDASGFPEALGVNPQVTIAAMSIKGARQILGN